MIGVDVRIDSTTNQLRVRFDQLPDKLRKRFEQTIRGLTNELLHKVQAREPVRTGLLRRQTHAYVDVNKVKNFVRGRVRVLNAHNKNVAAAFGALEYGSTGKRFPVQAYTRGRTSVRAYTRRGGIKAHRFLRGPAATMIPKARLELQRVLQEVTGDALKD